MADFDGIAILTVLAAHDVHYVVIGGWAAVAQGSPIPTRDVEDVPENHKDNLTRLSAALTELDARIRNGDGDPLPFRHDATSLAGSLFWNPTTTRGDLNLSFDRPAPKASPTCVGMRSPSPCAVPRCCSRRWPTSSAARRRPAAMRTGRPCPSCGSSSPSSCAPDAPASGADGALSISLRARRAGPRVRD